MDIKVSKRDVNFLLNGKQDMEATELHNLLANTQIEEFDAVEEAFNLLDVDRQGYLTVETFKTIFEKLKLGTIEPNEEKIFREVADFDEDGKISLEDFRKILTYNTGEEEDDQPDDDQQQQMLQMQGMDEMDMDDMEDMEDMEDMGDEDEDDEEEQM